jgi:Flp pilus assembly protein TadG
VFGNWCADQPCSRALDMIYNRRVSKTRTSHVPHRTGSAMVEVAVCFPVFLMILMGMIEFGRAMSINQLLNSSSRIGCRSAILDGSTNTAVTAIVKEHVASTIGCQQSSVNVTIVVKRGTTTVASLDAAKSGDVIEIDTSVPFSAVSWAVSNYLSSASVRGECAMVRE